ncbi:hypothetical protein GCM10009713_34170 [Brevibacterium celere]
MTVTEGSGTGDPIDARGRAVRSSSSAEVFELRLRVERIERIIVTGHCLITAVLLILGTFVPMYRDGQINGPDLSWSVATTVAYGMSLPFSSASPVEEPSGVEVVLLVGFIGLGIIIALILLVVLPTAVTGQSSARLLTFSRIVVVLGVIGAVVPLLLTGLALNADGDEGGWGGVLLFAGMLGALIVILPSFRELAGLGDERL